MCTNIKIKTVNNEWITGRTNEFFGYFKSDLVFLPRGYEYPKFFNRPDLGTEKLSYAMIGETAKTAEIMEIDMDANSFIDGINEFGLSVSTLYFSIGFEWKVVEESDLKPEYISGYVLTNWLLGQCKTTKEVRAWMTKNYDRVVILKTEKEVQGFHFAVVDATGDSIVIEPENGRLYVKENFSGVMTNSPRLEWHQENLANFINLTPIDTISNSKIIDKNGKPIIKRTMSNGLKNLPGDWQSTSRYIRAHYLSLNASKPKTIEEGINTTFRILHTSDIVAGTIITPVPDEFMKFEPLVKTDLEGSFIADITDCILVKDLTNKIYYYKDIHNISPRFVKLTDYLDETEVKRIDFGDDKSLKFQEVKLI